jgi:outer membrane protein with beta-barrel domain
MRLGSVLCVAFALVLLSALPASAQPASARSWGVDVGGGVSYLTVPKGTSRSMGADISGGVFVNVPFISVYRLQPELRFDHRESKVRGTTRTFDFLDVPILVHIKVFKGLFMNEGPAFHVPLRAKVESAGRETDVKSNTRTDISLVMGVGARTGKKITIEGRWDSGIKGTQKTVASGDVATRHRSITGLILIDLSKK